MKIKIVPIKLEVDLHNTDQPVKVHYTIELSTKKFNDVFSGGVTHIAGDKVRLQIQALSDAILSQINVDLGLEEQETTNNNTKEEDSL